MGLLRRELGNTVNDPIISVRDLGISFPGKHRAEPIHVLRSLNLEVRRGEFVCIVGPSGCGKTTLLNSITGFIRQSKGEIFVQGTPVTGPDPKRICVSGQRSFSMVHRRTEHRVWAQSPSAQGTARNCASLRSNGWTDRFRKGLSPGAVGGNASAS